MVDLYKTSGADAKFLSRATADELYLTQETADERYLGFSLYSDRGSLVVGYDGLGVTILPAGSNGQVLSSNSEASSGLEWITPSGGGGSGGGIIEARLFTSSGTWTKPEGCKRIDVTVIGGGGSGGAGALGTPGNSHGGSGGNGGFYTQASIYDTVIGGSSGNIPSTAAVTVGAGGGAKSSPAENGPGQSGSAGGTSSFGASVSIKAPGGAGGAGGGVSGINRGFRIDLGNPNLLVGYSGYPGGAGGVSVLDENDPWGELYLNGKPLAGLNSSGYYPNSSFPVEIATVLNFGMCGGGGGGCATNSDDDLNEQVFRNHSPGTGGYSPLRQNTLQMAGGRIEPGRGGNGGQTAGYDWNDTFAQNGHLYGGGGGGGGGCYSGESFYSLSGAGGAGCVFVVSYY